MKNLTTWLFAALVMAWLVVHETGMLEDRFGPEQSPGQRVLAAELPAASTATWSPVAQVQLPQMTWATGALTANHATTVAPEVAGRIVTMDLEVGQAVAMGELLFAIDPRTYQTAVSRAEAGLLVIRANVEASEAGVAVAKAAVKGAESALEFAKIESDRQVELFAKKATTDQAMTAAKAAHAAAKASLKQAQAQVLVADAAVAAATSNLKPAMEELAMHQLALDRTQVSAPIAGVVTARLQEKGSVAAAGRGVVTLRAQGDLRASACFQEGLNFELGTELLWDLPGAELAGRGRVVELASALDPRTRTRTVHVALDGADVAALKPGQFARLGLATASEEVLVIPRAAVMRRGQVQSVGIRRGDKIVRQHVRAVEIDPGVRAALVGASGVPAGIADGDWLRVLTGLSSADEVQLPAAGTGGGQ